MLYSKIKTDIKNNLFTWIDVSSASLYDKLILLVVLSSYIGNILPPSFIQARHLFSVQELIFELIIWRDNTNKMTILIKWQYNNKVFFESLWNLNDRSGDDYLGKLWCDICNISRLSDYGREREIWDCSKI